MLRQYLYSVLFFFLSLSLSVSPSDVSGQDRVTLLTGKVLEVKSASINDSTVTFQKFGSTSMKRRVFEKRKVFSVTFETGKEKVVYEPDSMENEEYNKAEMRMYVQGEIDAREHFRSPLTTIGGVAVGSGGAFFAIYGSTLPMLYSGSVVLFKTNMAKQNLPDQTILDSEPYINGYSTQARKKRIKNALIGSVSGYLVSIGVLILIFGK